ncbi:hypothetical protein MKD41_02515 [Lutibacter sp. A64]|uniref:hypothetical protein n=1 Tax=Lutibacter sp. A64 TaxID=2918526 RepID=UPI001F06A0F1|nr:hypothetical protein [Lutibacter sp. A64]UMB54363.1 hypothetical protein MKD41_02515 [Lutibacter sp. A64]
MKQKKNWLIWLILLITLIRVGTYTSLVIGNTTFWWVVEFIIIALCANISYTLIKKNKIKSVTPLKYLLIWNSICIVRGFFVADNYWEWKNLVSTSLMLFIPLVIYLSNDTVFLRNLLRKWLKYMPFLFLFFIPFTIGKSHGADLYGKYFIPILFLLPFVSLLSNKYRYVILFISIIIVLFSLDARSNIIRFLFAGVLGAVFYFRRIISPKLLQIASLGMFILPVILLILGISGKFNIFKMDEYIKGNYSTQIVIDGEVKEHSLTGDTRTFLYVEVIQSAFRHGYVLFGRTPARGYDSQYFGDYLAEELGTGKQERFASEVAIHNIFTWNGIIGVCLYFLVFFRASFLALYKSKSYLIKLLGVFVAFRWVYAFVEDFTTFELQYIFLWFTIGICYSVKFRAMNDTEIKHWVRGIFDKRYRKLEYLKHKRKKEWALTK